MKDFLTLAAERYSVRSFKPDPVSDEDIVKILEAAKLAPTARNDQPQKIYVLKSPEAIEKINSVSPCIYGAPLVFAIGWDPAIAAPSNIEEGYCMGDIDSTIVCAHMILEAADLGLGSCWVGRFVSEEVKAALGLPAEVKIRHLLPVGYPTDDCVPAPKHTDYRPMDTIVTEL